MVALTLRLCGLAAALLFACGLAFAQPERAEVQIKAAFLYKFGGFIEWPPQAFARPDGRFTIGVVGADDIAAELEQLVAGRTVHDRPVAVRRLRRAESLSDVHVLFVGRSQAARLAELLEAAKSQPLLVVTESADALAQGSTINFVQEGNKVRFDVALPQAERSSLRISARLLSVARKVVTSS
jgi:YfiR/HmsC-like